MKILFLCVSNSVRSQMAEGLAREIFQEDAEIFSAGIKPSYVHPTAIIVMQELGIDISSQCSKSVDDVNVYTMDYIISVCGDDLCPVVPETVMKEYWPLPIPSSDLNSYRAVRDDLKRRIVDFKKRIS
jgi:arsenate reductase